METNNSIYFSKIIFNDQKQKKKKKCFYKERVHMWTRLKLQVKAQQTCKQVQLQNNMFDSLGLQTCFDFNTFILCLTLIFRLESKQVNTLIFIQGT